MAANNYLDTDFNVYFLPKGRKIVFPRGGKSHWFFRQKLYFAYGWGKIYL